MALLVTASPLARPAAAADGDVVTTFGTNGRVTDAVAPAPEIQAVDVVDNGGPLTTWVQHSGPGVVTVTQVGSSVAIERADACSTGGCRIAGSSGYGGEFFLNGGQVLLNQSTGLVSVGPANLPGTTTDHPTRLGPGAFAAEVTPDDPAQEPYLAVFPNFAPDVRRLGPVGLPEVLVGGRLAVASGRGRSMDLRFYAPDGRLDRSRADDGLVSIANPVDPVTVDAVVAQADGGVVVVARHAPAPGAPTGITVYRLDARGAVLDVVEGPELTWSPTLVELPGSVVAYVGTPSAPTTSNTMVRVDTASAAPFSTVTLTGGPTTIDGAVADAVGRLVVVGGGARPRSTMTVARFAAGTGTLDNAFGTNGVVNRALPDATSRSFRLDIGADGAVNVVASQNAGILIDRLVGSAPAAHRTRVPLDGLQPPSATGAFTPITPVRAFDSRILTFPLQAAESRTVDLSAVVPEGTSAVALNVTAVDPAAPGFVRVWSADEPMPETSMLNYDGRETVANATVSALGARRALSVYSHVATDLVVDVVGYWTPTFESDYGRIVPLTPTRLLDTRLGGAPRLADEAVTTVDIHGRPGLASATAVVVTVTVAEPVGPGFVTVWPDGVVRPLASTLNVNEAGELRTNMAFVGVGADGGIALFNQRGTHLVVDLVGYVTASSDEIARSGLFLPIPPQRVVDSRTAPAGGVRAATPTRVTINPSGQAGSTAVYNLTAVDTVDAGFLTAYPVSEGANVPLASSVNFEAAGQRRASLAVTPLDVDGAVALYANVGTDYVADLLGTLS